MQDAVHVRQDWPGLGVVAMAEEGQVGIGGIDRVDAVQKGERWGEPGTITRVDDPSS